MQNWLITGANGNIGKRLLTFLLGDADCSVVAVVRSARAKGMIENLQLDDHARRRLQIEVVDYVDVTALQRVAEHANKAVHLVGILKQSKLASYADAHEASTAALLQALQQTGVDHLTYLSIIGSNSLSANACLASKGRAEDLCEQSTIPTCVLKVPMVLGEGDYASTALGARAATGTRFTFRAASLEQPIYAGDVVRAIVAAGSLQVNATLELAGTEVLSRRALTERAAMVLGSSARLISLPLALGLAVASLMEVLLANPPVTRAMLQVLDHDDDIDPQAALEALQLDPLTSLDDTLRAVLGPAQVK